MKRRKEIKINAAFYITYLFQLIVIAIVGMSVPGKLLGAEAAVQTFTMLGMEPHGRIIIGFLELIACVLLLFPRLSATGALLTGSITLIAMITHITDLGINQWFIMAMVVFVLSSIIMWSRKQYLPLIGDTM